MKAILCCLLLICAITAGMSSETNQDTKHLYSSGTEQCAPCTNCGCNGNDECPVPLFPLENTPLVLVECGRNMVPAIGKITMEIVDELQDEGFAYMLLDDRNIRHPLKSRASQNCSTDSTHYRLSSPGNAHVIATSSSKALLPGLKYNIQTGCVSLPADYHSFRVTPMLKKYYSGHTVSVTITFINEIYHTVDTWLQGTLKVKNSKSKKDGKVVDGVGTIDIVLSEQIPTSSIQFEYIQDPKYTDKTVDSLIYFPLDLPIVREAAIGKLKLSNKQIISGKEFTVYFAINDSDNIATPIIDIFLLEVISSTKGFECVVSSVEFGRGIIKCSSETSGQSAITLKYNGVKLDELVVTVRENPNGYVEEGTALLLVLLIVICSVLLCVVVGSIGCIWYRLKRRRDIPSIKEGRQPVREEDVEELDL